ncbi:MAG: IS110 family transposase [Armatimonadota bacterium]|nr:IS110 family transposase [Armatimonadota bacterium]
MKFYGVDVSKEKLDIACEGSVMCVENNEKAIKSLVKTMPADACVAMEATNAYHLPMADLCFAAGMRVYVVNPRVTRHYREVMSLRGHTDKMDAKALSRFVEREHKDIRAYTPKSAETRRLQTLIRRRSKLVRVKPQLSQSLGQVKELKSDLRVVMEKIEGMIAKIELLIEKQLEGNTGRQRIATIKGVGPVVSAALVADLDNGHFRSGDSFVAFYGLDLKPNDSGKSTGRRKLSKQGDRLGRTLLYNAAMAAVKSEEWKPIYERHIARGLTKIQALVVIARKIAETAWSIYTHGTEFDSARIQACRA